MAKTKPILGDCLYVVEAGDDEIHQVYKIIKDLNARPDPYVVDSDLTCTCMAGEQGRECRHSKMVSRTLLGNEVLWADAVRLTNQCLKKIMRQWENAQVQSLLDFKEPEETVRIAHALVCGALNETDQERLTIWTEVGPLLVVFHVFQDPKRYARTLRRARKKSEANSKMAE